MNSAAAFEIVFILFLFGNFVLKYYLDRRQVQSILRNRGAVPLAFAGKISLEAHQKAADYSVERIKFGQLTRITDLGFVLTATFRRTVQGSTEKSTVGSAQIFWPRSLLFWATHSFLL